MAYEAGLKDWEFPLLPIHRIVKMHRATAQRERLLFAAHAFWTQRAVASLLSSRTRMPANEYELAGIPKPVPRQAPLAPGMTGDQRADLKELSRQRREAAARGELGH